MSVLYTAHTVQKKETKKMKLTKSAKIVWMTDIWYTAPLCFSLGHSIFLFALGIWHWQAHIITVHIQCDLKWRRRLHRPQIRCVGLLCRHLGKAVLTAPSTEASDLWRPGIYRLQWSDMEGLRSLGSGCEGCLRMRLSKEVPLWHHWQQPRILDVGDLGVWTSTI